MLDVWGLKIIRIDNGYRLINLNKRPIEALSESVIEDKENDELESTIEMLWEVLEFFNMGGSKHDPERIKIVKEKT